MPLWKPVPPFSVEMFPEFEAWYKKLDKNCYLHKIVDRGLDTLSEHMYAGSLVRKRQIPKKYVRKYGIYNLYVYHLDSFYRMTYTVALKSKDAQKPSVFIIEVLDHPHYDRLFGYRTS